MYFGEDAPADHAMIPEPPAIDNGFMLGRADTPYPRAAIVGTGRVATSLGRAMVDCGWTPGAIAGRDLDHAREAAGIVGTDAASIPDVARQFEYVIVAVSDDAIESIAGALASAGMKSGCALHTSGAKGPEPLDALGQRGVACASMHPLQTIVDPQSGPAALRACYFALSGAPAAIHFAEAVARCVGARTFTVEAAARPLYHAAAVLASNYVSALLDAALTVMESIGMDRESALEAIRPLFESAARNSASMGPERALTGPIARGDAGTLRAHVLALAQLNAEIASVYQSVGRHAVGIARRRGLPAGAASELAAALTSNA